MGCPTLNELPPPPPGKTGWPWTEESPQLPDTEPDGLLWPRVSIVTPSYNQGQFLEETIRSVLLQGYPNLEYIIIDGGSTDGSVEIIRKYEPWLAYWVSEPDRGQARAINKGFERATGEILAWLNADDWYPSGTLEAVAQTALEHSQATLLYGDCEEIDADGHSVGIKRLTRFDLATLLRGRNMAQPAVFWHCRVLEEVGGLDEQLHYALDFEFFLRIWYRYSFHGLAEQAFVYVPQVLAYSRLWEEAKTVSRAAQFGSEYRAVLDRFFQQPDLPVEIRRLKPYAYSYGVYWRSAQLLWRFQQPVAARKYFLLTLATAPTLKGKWRALKYWLLTFKKNKPYE